MSMQDVDRQYVDVEQGLGRVAGNAKLYARLLSSFQSNTRIQELLDALDAQDNEAAIRATHTIKGVAGNLSLMAFNAQIIEIEQGLKEGRVPDDGQLSKLKACLDATLEQAEKVIAGS